METGQWVVTRKINAKMETDINFARFMHSCVAKYINRDQGDICKEDWDLNDSAVKNGDDRIVAKYDNIFIITEHDCSATTILFTDEY